MDEGQGQGFAQRRPMPPQMRRPMPQQGRFTSPGMKMGMMPQQGATLGVPQGPPQAGPIQGMGPAQGIGPSPNATIMQNMAQGLGAGFGMRKPMPMQAPDPRMQNFGQLQAQMQPRPMPPQDMGGQGMPMQRFNPQMQRPGLGPRMRQY